MTARKRPSRGGCEGLRGKGIATAASAGVYPE